MKCSWKLVTIGVTQGPALFNVFINDQDNGTHCISGSLQTKLGCLADRPDGCAAIQRNLNTLDNWINRNLTKFEKREILSPVLGDK